MTATTVLGTCHHDCPDSCGWVATVDNGVAVKLRGNPEHPYSRGELCPKVNRFIDRVYSADRILHPLIRSGEKGSGTFRQATWEEGLGLVADRVGEIVEKHGGEAVLPWWDAGTQGLLQMSCLDRRFFARLGSSRLIGSLCGATAGAGTATTNGSGLAADPSDVRFAQLALLWGTNTKLTNRHLWPFVEEARANGGRVVVIDPIRTITAEAADWFIQPLPGTDVALILGLIHVLVRDDLIDHAYVDAHTDGFDALADHVRGWTPERASQACGVPVAEIEQLALAYGTAAPAFIRTLIGAEHYESGAMFFRTLACLPALTGSWKHRGGGLARSVGSWADVNVDAGAFDAPHLAKGRERRSFNMNRLGRVLTDVALDPPVKALFVWNGNPAVSVPNSAEITRGLRRDDLFTVVSEQFMTDTARHADVVFPATTQLEQRDVVPAWGHLYLGWNEPAIEPLGEAVRNTELWRRLAEAMGFTEPELFESDDSLLASALVDVDLDALRRDGFVRLDVPDDLRPYADGGFPTATGRAELWGDRPPTFVPAQEGPAAGGRYPLSMLSPKVHTRFLNSSYSHHHGEKEGGPYVELDRVDAEDRGIVDGDMVEVFNDRATLRLPARVSGRMRPGVVAVPFGWWGADHDGGTVNSLTNDTITDWGGGVAFNDTRVDVRADVTPGP